jgi:hypothetical protein
MDANPKTENSQSQPQRNFVIPGCSVIVQSDQEEGIPVDRLLSIVFGLATANPNATVDFWIKVQGGE